MEPSLSLILLHKAQNHRENPIPASPTPPIVTGYVSGDLLSIDTVLSDLSCVSEGIPEPEVTWVDVSDGSVVSASSTVTWNVTTSVVEAFTVTAAHHEVTWRCDSQSALTSSPLSTNVTFNVACESFLMKNE